MKDIKSHDLWIWWTGYITVELVEETEKEWKFQLLDNFDEPHEDEDILTVSKKENVWVLNPTQW